MIRILLLLFGAILLLIGWYFIKHTAELEIIFTKKNETNLKHMSLSFLFAGVVGIGCGLVIPVKIVALFFIFLVLIISAIYSIQLSRFMK